MKLGKVSSISRETKIQFLKFVGVGFLNTGISLLVIYLLMSLGVNYRLSNLIGYIAGVVNSFLWSKFWVFASNKNLLKELILFFISFGICYALQYGALLLLVEQWGWNAYFSQLIAMGVYTVTNFLLNRLVTFRK